MKNFLPSPGDNRDQSGSFSGQKQTSSLLRPGESRQARVICGSVHCPTSVFGSRFFDAESPKTAVWVGIKLVFSWFLFALTLSPSIRRDTNSFGTHATTCLRIELFQDIRVDAFQEAFGDCIRMASNEIRFVGRFPIPGENTQKWRPRPKEAPGRGCLGREN